jgi:hypothetical protein
MNTSIDCLKSKSTQGLVTRFRTRKGALAAALLLFGAAGLAEASSTVTVTAQNLWNNQVIYTAESNPVDSSACGVQTVTAPSGIIETVSGVTTTYAFLFWDVNAQLHTNPTVKFQPVCGAANSAVAVYWPTGGCAGCPPPTTDSVFAYSLNDAKIIPGVTPIASATSGWTAGSNSVTPPSTIEAEAELPPYGKFKAWAVLGGGAPYSMSSSLTLTGAGAVAMAFYGYPDPDPCQPIRNELDNPGLCEGLPTPAACETLRKALNFQLQACMTANGE